MNMLMALAMAAATSAADKTVADKGDTSEQPLGKMSLPEVSLESVTGGGKLSIKEGLTARLAGDWVWTPSLLYTASSTDGIASLFEVAGDRVGVANDWGFGPNVTFASLSYQQRSAADRAVERAAKEKAYASCIARCTPVNQVSDKDKAFCSFWREQVAYVMPAERFCSEQKEKVAGLPAALRLKGRKDALDACLKPCEDDPAKSPWCAATPLVAPPGAYLQINADDKNDPRALCPEAQLAFDDALKKLAENDASAFPSAIVNVGAKFGQSHFTYLAPSSKVAGQVDQQKSALFNVSFGVSGWKIVGQGAASLTLEYLANFSAAWEGASDKAHWCKSVNPVVDPQQPSGDPAAICADTPYGAPSRANDVTLAAYIGSVDQASPSYRVALGAQADVWTRGGKDQARLAVSAPVTLALFQYPEIGFAGVLKVGPIFGCTWHHESTTHPAGGSDLDFGVSLSFSAQKYLFSQQFDRL